MVRVGVGGGGGSIEGPKTVVVLDNGAGFCKAGFAGQSEPLAVVPNCAARPLGAASGRKWLLADQAQQCEEIQGLSLRRPFDRGYLVNADLERDIWDRIFKALLRVKPSDCGLLLVDPLFNLPSIQRATDELIFEDLGFHSLFVADSPSLTHLAHTHAGMHTRARGRTHARANAFDRFSLVVDCGFSFTHAAPVVQGFTCNASVKRVDLGGKALTNYLKELVSYRSWNVMEETYIMEDVKEKLCYCSLDMGRDLEVARRTGKDNYIRCKYVLPDGIKHKRGFIKDPDFARLAFLQGNGEPPSQSVSEKEWVEDESMQDASPVKDRISEARSSGNQDQQELTLTNERFLVPEMLFHPADLGMNEAGLAECIIRAVSSCHPHLHPLLYSSVVLTGGSTLFPGFKERLIQELRPLVPDKFELNVSLMEDPILATWRGGSLLGASPDFTDCCVTKREYEEIGSLRCRRRFMH